MLELAEKTVDLVENTHRLKNTRSTLSKTEACRTHSWTPVSPFVRFHLWLLEIKCMTNSLATWIKHMWVARCDFTCRNWPDRLSWASQITYWLAIAYCKANKLFFRLSVYLRVGSRHKNCIKRLQNSNRWFPSFLVFRTNCFKTLQNSNKWFTFVLFVKIEVSTPPNCHYKQGATNHRFHEHQIFHCT